MSKSHVYDANQRERVKNKTRSIDHGFLMSLCEIHSPVVEGHLRTRACTRSLLFFFFLT